MPGIPRHYGEPMTQLAVRPVPLRRISTGGVLFSALPALGGLGAVAYMFAGPPHPVTYIAGAMFAFSSLAMVASTVLRSRGQLKSGRVRDRARYATYLDSLHEELYLAGNNQSRYSNSPHRVIVGSHTAPHPHLPLPPDQPDDPDPVCLELLELALAEHQMVADTPVIVDLDHGELTIRGPGRDDSARVVLCQLAANSSLDFSILSANPARWGWARWIRQLGPECRIGTGEELLPIADSGLVVDDLDNTSIHIYQLSRRNMCTEVEVHPAGASTLRIKGRNDQVFSAVGMTRKEAEVAARASRGASATTVRLPAQSGLSNNCLAFTIGQDRDGAPVQLDIREADLGGQGPHGLIVGATGSGKSELLRTIVVSAIITNTPQMLNLVLIDFKGGATFADFDGFGHIAGTITNLQNDTGLVERMREVLEGELSRRQQVLHEAGGLASLRELNALAVDGHPVEPVLLIIVDEFAELLTQDPELASLFVKIGRLGRSLGVHLLLATQRLDEGKIRGLEAHLSYRIALRVFSAAESRAAIGVPDAADLPRAPGHALFREGTAAVQPFRAHRIGDLLRPSTPRQQALVSAVPHTYQPTQQLQRTPNLSQLIDTETPADIRLLWLPPLVTSPRHHELAEFGSALVIPIGLIDRPSQQRRDQFMVDLRGSGSHVAIVGGPGSGTSTLMATLIHGISAQQSPQQAQVYLIDTASMLQSLQAVPHVGEVITASDSERVRRLIAIALSTLHARQSASLKGWSLEQLRSDPAPSGYGELMIGIDGFGAFSREYDDLLPAIRQLVERGASYGIHLIVTANRWLDIRHDLRGLFAIKIELRLADPVDSEIDRRAQTLLLRTPGHGLAPDGSVFLGAIPGMTPTDPAIRRAPSIGVLPSRVTAAAIPYAPAGSLVIGVEGTALSAMAIDTTRYPGALILGEAASGKTSFLVSMSAQIARWTEHRMIIIDPRRRLSALPCHRRAHAPADIREAVAEVIAASDCAHSDQVILIDDYDLLPSFDNPLAPLVELLPWAVERGISIIMCRRSNNLMRALADPLVSGLVDNDAPVVLLSTPEDEGRILGVRAARHPIGRGVLVHRDIGTRDIQLLTDPIPTPPSHHLPHLPDH